MSFQGKENNLENIDCIFNSKFIERFKAIDFDKEGYFDTLYKDFQKDFELVDISDEERKILFNNIVEEI
jgi:hypothetical protein